MTTATQTRPKQATILDAPRERIGDESLVNKLLSETSRRVDARAKLYVDQIEATDGQLEKAMLMAAAVTELEAAITSEMMVGFMRLYNHPMGFKCDKPNKNDRNPYSVEEVKSCVVHGLLQGVFPVGNQWNIIAGKCYITKEGYAFKLSRVPGLTDLEVAPGVPLLRDGRTVVRVGAAWILDGRHGELMGADRKPGRVYSIIIRNGSTDDQTVGKATRKALKSIWEKVTGSPQTEDADISELEEMPKAATGTRADQLAAKLQPAASQAAAVATDDGVNEPPVEREAGQDG